VHANQEDTVVVSSLDIARAHQPIPIETVAERAGLLAEEIEPYGRDKAKISPAVLDRLRDAPDAKLVCVTSITPTAAGEGNTTTAVGLTQGLGALGHRAVACLREASVGPVFGFKGGAAGGGHAQVVPMEDLNLHFTGDIHAIGAANNLLAAILDASILHGNPHGIDALRIPWRRAVDMNDRALRRVVVGRGGRANGYPRETGFDITAASEVMGLVGVARSLADLRRRLGQITAAYSFEQRPVTAEDLGAAGAMTVLLKDALKPNLVQTLEGQPAIVHCGPFGNIDHGNSSLIADLIALKLGDYVVTECGFGSDMGLEKFCDIVCRLGGLRPGAVVLVVTTRAIKHHGGLSGRSTDSAAGARGAIESGMANVGRHLQIAATFGIRCVVAVNRFAADRDADVELIKHLCLEAGAFAAETNDAFAHGGPGATALASAVIAACREPRPFTVLYPDDAPIHDKIAAVARQVYGATDLFLYPEAERKIAQFTDDGLGRLPVCIAKTHLSLSADPALLNAPQRFTLPVRDIRAYTGAGWLVPLCGEVSQMPGLGPTPAATRIDVGADGQTVGLF
jgi:formate--tetrahydrofolate ligase